MMQEYGSTAKLLSNFEMLNQVCLSLPCYGKLHLIFLVPIQLGPHNILDVIFTCLVIYKAAGQVYCILVFSLISRHI